MSEDKPKKILTHAEIMRKSIEKKKKETGDKSYERKLFKVYPLISHIFGMSAKEFKTHWYSLDNPGKEIAQYFRDMYDGEGISRVRVYRGQLGSIGELLSEKIGHSPLWKHLIQVWPECKGLPIVPFFVKGVKDPFILTNDDGKGNIHTNVLVPRIRIPAGGQSNDIYIYSLSTYLKENKNE